MNYIYIGKIVNTHGIKGEVRILSKFRYKSKVFNKHFKIYIGKDKCEEIINSYRPHKQFDMITIEGINNINDVLKYKGKPVYINKEDLSLNKDEYLDEDLIGLNVVMNNKVMGKIEKIERDTNQDKIIVNKDNSLYLVPYVNNLIKDINLKDNIITLEYIKGLLD